MRKLSSLPSYHHEMIIHVESSKKITKVYPDIILIVFPTKSKTNTIDASECIKYLLKKTTNQVTQNKPVHTLLTIHSEPTGKEFQFILTS